MKGELHMDETPQTTELKLALIELENMVATPPEVSEMKQWCARLRPTFERLESLVQSRRNRIHDKLFSEIADQRPDQYEQISKLRHADKKIEEFFDVIRTNVIVVELPTVESDEEQTRQQIVDLSDRATELIYWVKDQEDTVAAWFAEAFAEES